MIELLSERLKVLPVPQGQYGRHWIEIGIVGKKCASVVSAEFFDNSVSGPYFGVKIRDDRARLIASAPEHAMVCRLICSGNLRWNGWGDGNRGDLQLGDGDRHATNLDEFGVPVVTDHLRDEIRAAGL